MDGPWRRRGWSVTTATGTIVGMRPRKTPPDPTTPEGQVAIHLDHLIKSKGMTALDLAEELNVSRATVFNWLRGQGVGGSLAHWPKIAKVFRLGKWQNVAPSEEILKKIAGK